MARITTIYRPDDTEIEIPTKWCICGTCQGEGKSSAYLGAFTQDEMYEQGEEFIEDYIDGAYDRPCDTCEGKGRVKENDLSNLSPSDLALYEKQWREDYQDRMTQRMEMMCGA